MQYYLDFMSVHRHITKNVATFKDISLVCYKNTLVT